MSTLSMLKAEADELLRREPFTSLGSTFYIDHSYKENIADLDDYIDHMKLKSTMDIGAILHRDSIVEWEKEESITHTADVYTARLYVVNQEDARRLIGLLKSLVRDI